VHVVYSYYFASYFAKPKLILFGFRGKDVDENGQPLDYDGSEAEVEEGAVSGTDDEAPDLT